MLKKIFTVSSGFDTEKKALEETLAQDPAIDPANPVPALQARQSTLHK